MKDLKRQDKNGVRTAVDIERRYKLQELDPTIEEVEQLKKLITIDDHLSATSTNPVQNRVITTNLNNKVSKETGKGLSTNDFTNEYKTAVDNINPDAEENVIESISVNGTPQTITNKNVDLDIDNNFTAEYQAQVDANTLARHTHSNKALLDTYEQTETNLASAVGLKHSHDNKTTLDSITSSVVSRWSNIAYYESGGSTNVNTTTEELVLSSTNTPDSSLWYVQTVFYSSKSATSNRYQTAYSYNADKPIMTRYYLNGSWSSWKSCEIKSSSISDYEGYIWYGNGELIQWGRVNITPTAANTITNATINFPISYDYAPDISAIPNAATPNIITTAVGGGTSLATAKVSMIIYMTRTNTASTVFRWRAIGRKAIV